MSEEVMKLCPEYKNRHWLVRRIDSFKLTNGQDQYILALCFCGKICYTNVNVVKCITLVLH